MYFYPRSLFFCQGVIFSILETIQGSFITWKVHVDCTLLKHIGLSPTAKQSSSIYHACLSQSSCAESFVSSTSGFASYHRCLLWGKILWRMEFSILVYMHRYAQWRIWFTCSPFEDHIFLTSTDSYMFFIFGPHPLILDVFFVEWIVVHLWSFHYIQIYLLHAHFFVIIFRDLFMWWAC